MNNNDYHTIAGYLSSSEMNRCKKNGLQWYTAQTACQWLDAFKQSWLPRKLRRKLYTLYSLGILPVVKQDFVIGVGMENPDLFNFLSKHMAESYLRAEDEAIMKGLGK